MQKSNRIVVANWKMYLISSSLDELITGLFEQIKDMSGVILCPSDVHLDYVFKLFSKLSGVSLCAQNISNRHTGAYTGQISPEIFKELGCEYALIGHSECRREHAEESNLISSKVERALDAELKPIICVGEPAQSRKEGNALEYVFDQLINSIPEKFQNRDLIVAYEPIWSIGSNTLPQNDQVSEVFELIKKLLPKAKTLYGGSVTPETSKEISKIELLDGVLVGKASIDVKLFKEIILQIQGDVSGEI